MPLITISQSMGSKGEAIAELVAEKLNYELFDDDKLQKIAKTSGLYTDDLVDLDENVPGLIDRILSNKPELYLDYMESVIFKVARNGEGVIMGHGSQMLLRDFSCAFHIRIHASQSTRIMNLMENQGLSRDTAEKLVLKFDHRQSGFFQYAFQMRWDDPALYDVAINTQKMSEDTAAKLIVETVQSEDINTCSLDAVDTMEKLSLQKQIHAELLKNNIETQYLHIEVSENAGVHITGISRSQEDIEKIKRVLKNVPHLKDVTCDIPVVTGTI